MTPAIPMAKQKAADEPADGRTTLKIEKDLYRRLAVIAAHKGLSVSALAKGVLAAYADDEYQKTARKMAEGD